VGPFFSSTLDFSLRHRWCPETSCFTRSSQPNIPNRRNNKCHRAKPDKRFCPWTVDVNDAGDKRCRAHNRQDQRPPGVVKPVSNQESPECDRDGHTHKQHEKRVVPNGAQAQGGETGQDEWRTRATQRGEDCAEHSSAISNADGLTQFGSISEVCAEPRS
jgi:hypothetical protein